MFPMTRGITSVSLRSFLISKTGLIPEWPRRSLPVLVDFLNSSSTECLRNFSQTIKSTTWWPREPFNTTQLHNLGALSQIRLPHSKKNMRWLAQLFERCPTHPIQDDGHINTKARYNRRLWSVPITSESSKSPDCCYHENWPPNRADPNGLVPTLCYAASKPWHKKHVHWPT